jgi:hypothetical protein
VEILFEKELPLGPAYAKPTTVKKAVFKATPGKPGFIRAMIAPCNEKQEPRFGWGDIITLMALIIGILALARIVLAH